MTHERNECKSKCMTGLNLFEVDGVPREKSWDWRLSIAEMGSPGSKWVCSVMFVMQCFCECLIKIRVQAIYRFNIKPATSDSIMRRSIMWTGNIRENQAFVFFL